MNNVSFGRKVSTKYVFWTILALKWIVCLDFVIYFLTPSSFSTDFTKFAMGASQKWKDVITLALTHKWREGLIVIYYENLLENPVREMRRIAEFLKLNSTDHNQNFEKRLICMQLDVKGNFKRPSRKLGFNPFTEEVQMAITDSVKKVNRTLVRLHLPTLLSSYTSRDI